MRELQFKKIDDRYSAPFKFNGYTIMIKPFYTSEEMMDVYMDIKEKSDAYNRNFTRVVHTAKICTSVDFTNVTDEEIYDICAEMGLPSEFFMAIDDYETVARMVKEDESAYNLVKELTDKLTATLEKAQPMIEKMGDGTGLIDKIKMVIGNVNK